MRIDRLIIAGFGRFQGRTLELKPGLNIIYGENESGKSTIQKFILGMLYGFKKRSLRREHTEDAYRFRPWAGDEYRGALLYTLDSTGASYRVERQFDPSRETARVYDALTGADLTGSFAMDRRKELLFAEEHLRIGAEVFTSTAWVGQMAVSRVEMGRELVSRVANLTESGREDVSVRQALSHIEEAMREIGSERAASKPYARLSRQIAQKRQEMEWATRKREQLVEWETGLSEARSAMAALDGQLTEARRALSWAQLIEAEELHGRITSATARMKAMRQKATALAPFAAFPAGLRDALLAAHRQSAEAAALLEQYRGRLGELMEAKAALEGHRAQFAAIAAMEPGAAHEMAAAARMLEADRARLPGLYEEEARLEEMIARIDEAIAPLLGAVESGGQVMEQVESIEQAIAAARARLEPLELDRLRSERIRLERAEERAGGWGWLALALGLLAGAAGGYLGLGLSLPLAVAMGMLGVLALIPFALAVRRRAAVARERVAAARALAEAESVRQAALEELHLWEQAREQAFRSVGVVTVGELRTQLVRYEQLAARRDGQALRRETIRAEIERAEEAIARAPELERFQAAAELRERIRLAEEQLGAASTERDAILEEAGVADLAAFAEGCAQHEEWRKAEQEAEGLSSALGALLGGGDGFRAAREVELLRSRVSGEPPAGEMLPAAVQQGEVRRLEQERADWHLRASDLAARVETAAAEIPSTADLQREIAGLQEEKLGLEQELAALELARTVIADVSSQMHRDFAPRLNSEMGRIVAQLTKGKYQAVRIDEAMAIRAIAEGDRTVEISSLSGGTIDQFYLALRVAVLDLLTEGQERIPLLLDDPFVQYDQERVEATISFLAELAQERQVLLMTCHRREAQIGRGLGAHVMEL